MNASFVRLLIVSLILCSPALLRAQSVESVLSALQERVMILDARDKYADPYPYLGPEGILKGPQPPLEPVKWPAGLSLSVFPKEGEIKSLPHAIWALNVASRVFDEIKEKFIAYDTHNHQFVNLRHVSSGGSTSYAASPISLPSVGIFTVSNWREKLQMLASNINQLKALEWPVFLRVLEASSFDYFGTPGPTSDKARLDPSGWAFSFPSLAKDGYGAPDAYLYNEYDYDKGGKTKDGVALDWSMDAYTLDAPLESGSFRGLDGEVVMSIANGARVFFPPLRSISAEANTPAILSDFEFYRGGSVFEYGDLTEGIAKQLSKVPGAAFPVGSLVRIEKEPVIAGRDLTAGFQLGEYGPLVEPISFNKVHLPVSSAVANAFSLMDSPQPMITATLEKAPALVQQYFQQVLASPFDGSFSTPFEFQLDTGATVRRAYKVTMPFPDRVPEVEVSYQEIHRFRMLVRAVCLPKFSTLSTTPVLTPLLGHQPGEVETALTSEEMMLRTDESEAVRIYVGRGIYDSNQIGWLRTRLDGFGSATFSGGPSAFELIYQTDIAKYGAVPYGGNTFDSATEFTEIEKKQSGWSSRFGYFAECTSPLLRQVRSKDVLVDITYSTPYQKNITFYWAKDIGNKGASGFYTPPIDKSFKTIVVKNPTAPFVGVPTERYHLKVEESGPERYHELTKTGKVFRVQLGTTIGAVESERTITQNDSPEVHVDRRTVKDTKGASSKETIYDYYTDTVSSSDHFELKSITTKDLGGDRVLNFSWVKAKREGYGTNSWALKGLSWTGPNSWKDNGRVVTCSKEDVVNGKTAATYEGVLSYESGWIGEKYHESTYAWADNELTTERSLDGAVYSKEVARYSTDYQQVNITDGSLSVATRIYSNTGDTIETIYPGGYREYSSWSIGSDGLSSTLKSGWGAKYQFGTVQQASYSLLGFLVSRSTSVTGILGDSKKENCIVVESVTGSDFTGFGAPKVLTGLRDEKTQILYNETGVQWGLPKEITSPTGRKQALGWDLLRRPTSWSNGFEAFTATYPELGKTSVTSDAKNTTDIVRDSTGGLQSFKQTGTWGNLSLVPGGTSSIEAFGQPKSLTVDASGILSSTNSGMGSRGAGFDFGVSASGELYTEVTPKTKDDASVDYTLRTSYDEKGRPKAVVSLGGDGSLVTEAWSYDDALRSVTYTAGAGPRAQNVQSTLSEDGSTLTVKKGGIYYRKYTCSIKDGELIRTTEVFNDSSGKGNEWTEVARETFNPATGTSTYTPRRQTANAQSITQSAPGATTTDTISNGASGDTVEITSVGGQPSAIKGTSNGVAIDLVPEWEKGRLTTVTGKIGGKDVALKLKTDGRLESIEAPGTKQVYSYENPLSPDGTKKGLSITVTDETQGTSRTVKNDHAGNLTEVSGAGSLPLTLTPNETASGSTTTLKVPGSNTSLLMSFNRAGSLVGKNYTDGTTNGGGINESYSPTWDGLFGGLTIEGLDEVSGSTATSSVTVVETETSRVTSYPDRTVTENYYRVGPRSSVSAPNDQRSFTYENLQLKTESHSSGPWAGWTVERLPDAKGRLGTLHITNGSALNWQFSFGYDDYSRLAYSTSYSARGEYSYYPTTGQIESLKRGAGRVKTTWWYDELGRLKTFDNENPSASRFTYNFLNYDSRNRIGDRIATTGGVSWSHLTYNGERLERASVANGRVLLYKHDVRGNRTGQQEAASINSTFSDTVVHSVNALDRIDVRTLLKRGFGVKGVVNPDATVLAFDPSVGPNGGISLPVDKPTGEFSWYWDVLDGTEGLVSRVVRATLPQGGTNGVVPAAEEELYFLLPPIGEVFKVDNAGRTKRDASWEYAWEEPGRLVQMTRRPGMFRKPNITSEVVDFLYDADGRRTQKTHTTTFANGSTLVEKSKVLWSGWLPIMEERSRNSQLIDRRLFHWGADLSGTLDGAGGIGGLVAIIEEKPSGQVRTLLPIQDGLGNVTAVINQASGATVARYDYGPFGEPLSETGEVDACPFRFQTKWYDAESEHYYFGYRYYSPRLGTWLSRDPLGEAGGVNLYAYCGNDPVNRHDPLGLDWRPFKENPGGKFANDALSSIADWITQKYDDGRATWRGFVNPNTRTQTVRGYALGNVRGSFSWLMGTIEGANTMSMLRDPIGAWTASKHLKQISAAGNGAINGLAQRVDIDSNSPAVRTGDFQTQAGLTIAFFVLPGPDEVATASKAAGRFSSKLRLEPPALPTVGYGVSGAPRLQGLPVRMRSSITDAWRYVTSSRFRKAASRLNSFRSKQVETLRQETGWLGRVAYEAVEDTSYTTGLSANGEFVPWADKVITIRPHAFREPGGIKSVFLHEMAHHNLPFDAAEPLVDKEAVRLADEIFGSSDDIILPFVD